jgi:hypothetical protein
MKKENQFGFQIRNVRTKKKKLEAEAHLAEGQFLVEEQILNKAKSLIYREGTRRSTISKTEEQNLEPR